MEALENFWNGWANRRCDIIVLIVSGSDTSCMADNLLDFQGGLYDHIIRRIYLESFTIGETEEYFKSQDFYRTRYGVLQCYMLTGGVPYYPVNNFG